MRCKAPRFLRWRRITSSPVVKNVWGGWCFDQLCVRLWVLWMQQGFVACGKLRASRLPEPPPRRTRHRTALTPPPCPFPGASYSRGGRGTQTRGKDCTRSRPQDSWNQPLRSACALGCWPSRKGRGRGGHPPASFQSNKRLGTNPPGKRSKTTTPVLGRLSLVLPAFIDSFFVSAFSCLDFYV